MQTSYVMLKLLFFSTCLGNIKFVPWLSRVFLTLRLSGNGFSAADRAAHSKPGKHHVGCLVWRSNYTLSCVLNLETFSSWAFMLRKIIFHIVNVTDCFHACSYRQDVNSCFVQQNGFHYLQESTPRIEQ